MSNNRYEEIDKKINFYTILEFISLIPIVIIIVIYVLSGLDDEVFLYKYPLFFLAAIIGVVFSMDSKSKLKRQKMDNINYIQNIKIDDNILSLKDKLKLIDSKLENYNLYRIILFIPIIVCVIYLLYGAINGETEYHLFSGEGPTYGFFAVIIRLLVIFEDARFWIFFATYLILIIIYRSKKNKLLMEKNNISCYFQQNGIDINTIKLEDANQSEEENDNVINNNKTSKIIHYNNVDEDNNDFNICPKCKSKVLKGSKFCMKCGEHIKK